MGRTAKAIIYGTSYKIITDLDDTTEGRSCMEMWDYLYPIYILDDDDRLVYVEQFHGGVKGINLEIQTITANMHPSAQEVFEQVEIIDDDNKKVLKVLKNVNLIGILEGIKEVFNERAGSGNPKGS